MADKADDYERIDRRTEELAQKLLLLPDKSFKELTATATRGHGGEVMEVFNGAEMHRAEQKKAALDGLREQLGEFDDPARQDELLAKMLYVNALDPAQPDQGKWQTQLSEQRQDTAAHTRRQPAGKSRFTLTPAFFGRSSVTFRLTPEDGGADTAYPYRVYLDEDGALLIAVTEGAEDSGASHLWNCVSDHEEIASVIGVITEETETIGYVRSGTTRGICTLRMYDPVYGVEITVECENRGNGSLLVVSHSIQAQSGSGIEDAEADSDPFDGKVFTFTPRSATGMRLDLADDGTGSRTLPQLCHAYRYAVRQWRVERAEQASLLNAQQPCYRIVSLYNAQALDSGDGAGSLWRFEDAGGGYYCLVPASGPTKRLAASGTERRKAPRHQKKRPAKAGRFF